MKVLTARDWRNKTITKRLLVGEVGTVRTGDLYYFEQMYDFKWQSFFVLADVEMSGRTQKTYQCRPVIMILK